MKLEIRYNVPHSLPRWPDDLEEMAGASFVELISTLQVDAVIGNGLDVMLGDSRNAVHMEGELLRGHEGTKQLKAMAISFAEGIRVSLDSMSGGYRDLYQKALDDFEKNGLDMPFVGRIM